MVKAKKIKKFDDLVFEDLTSLEISVEGLREVLDNFEQYDADEILEYCDQIEELAIAIKKGVGK